MNTDFLHITDAIPVCGYILRLSFSNGEVKDFDFKKVYDKGVFTKLKDKQYFLDYSLDGWTVDWHGEIGFAPEFLYANSTPANRS